MRPIMTLSRPFPAFARKPDWAREMRKPTAREWNQSFNDAKSTKHHCGKLHAAPTWMHLVLHPSYKGGLIDYDDLLEHMRFLPETPERWPLLPHDEGQLPNETVPEFLARFGMGEYSVAMIQLHATLQEEEAEEEPKLSAIADHTRPLAIANDAPAPPQPRPPLRVETAATGVGAPQRPPSRAPETESIPAPMTPWPKPPPPPPSGTGSLSCLPRKTTPTTPQTRPPTVDAATQTDEAVLERIGNPTWVRFRCPHTDKTYWWHNQSNEWWWVDSKDSGWTKYRDPRTMQYFWACDASTSQWDMTDWFWDIGDDRGRPWYIPIPI